MRIAILGATGLVGRETLALVSRAWPGATVDLYASRSGQSVRLRIFIDDNRAASSFFECPPGTVSTDVIGAIGRCG